MKYGRREFLLGSASVVATLSMAGRPWAQNGDANTRAASQIFGMKNLRGPDLAFLRQTQENATPAPLNLNDFQAYLDQNAIFQRLQAGESPEFYHLMLWHAVALDLTAQDHATVAGSTDPLFAEQFGPARTSRVMAIMHLAVFEAVNAIYQTHKSYQGLQTQIYSYAGASAGAVSPTTASVRMAINYAAFDTLTVLYPKKAALTSAVFNRVVLLNPDEPATVSALGASIGQAAAKAVLLARNYDYANAWFNDGSGHIPANGNSLSIEPAWQSIYPGTPGVLDWQQDPITQLPFALGAHWSQVTPFVLSSLPLPPPPPQATDLTFGAAYQDVARQGGDPNAPSLTPRFPTATLRTGAQPGSPLNATNNTFHGMFWGYDGTALLCAPPRLYNMIATSIALKERPITSVNEMAFYLALVNVAMADAGIAAWNAKYFYHYARPVTYIRYATPASTVLGTPTPQWTPLGAPDTNGGPSGSNLTPPFPAYPSGHATFGGTLFQVLRRYFNTARNGEISFQFVSDEYNGINKGANGVPRPRVVRTFDSLTDAETENARSRVWIGVHWQFDADYGVALGNRIGDQVFNYFAPNPI